jgi:hypothetical protein
LSEESRTYSGITARGVRCSASVGPGQQWCYGHDPRRAGERSANAARDEVAGAWEEAFSADRSVVYEAIVDAEVPPMPPHISFDQAKSITRALYRGNLAAEIIRHSFAELVEEYIPHR